MRLCKALAKVHVIFNIPKKDCSSRYPGSENAGRQAGTLRINTVFRSRQSVKHKFGIK
jgi:hypothetical protein